MRLIKSEDITVAIITLSDRSFRGEREDLSGPAIEKLLTQQWVTKL